MSAQHRFEWVQRSTTKRIGDLGFRAAGEIDRRKLGTGDLGFSSHPPPGSVGPETSPYLWPGWKIWLPEEAPFRSLTLL